MLERRRSLCLVIAALLTCGLVSCVSPSRVPSTRVIENDKSDVVDKTELVVLTETDAGAARIVFRASKLGYSELRRERLNALSLTMLVLRVPKGTDGPVAIGEVESLNAGTIAGVNHAYRLQATSHGLEHLNYADRLIGWPTEGCLAQHKIGVLDTAIKASALGGRGSTVLNRSFVHSPSGEPSFNHGTGVAKILAGQGRLNRAQILNAVVVHNEFTEEDAAGADQMVAALNWLVAEDARIINVSLAGPYNKILDKAVQRVSKSGALLIAAVGNDGPSAHPRYPAAFPEVVAVTAIDADQSIYKKAVHGSYIDLSAPGVDVLVDADTPNPSMLSGTSIATPFITALFASSKDLPHSGRHADIAMAFEGRIDDLGSTGPDSVFGLGLPKLSGRCH